MDGVYAAALGRAAYERSNLTTAVLHFQQVTSRKYRISYPSYMFAVVGLVLVAIANGALAEADELDRIARAFSNEAGGAFLRHQAHACAARSALARGDLPSPLAAAEAIGVDMHLGLTSAMKAPRLTQVHALIAAGDAVRIARVATLLASCVAEIASFHNTRLQIRALALSALLRQAQRRPAEAAAALNRAVALAAPLGSVRIFADLGPALHTLLKEHDVSEATRRCRRWTLRRSFAACGP